MNGRHWSDYTEAELANMRGTVRASGTRGRPARGPVDVTAETQALLKTLPRGDEPAYPPEWLPEISAARTPQFPIRHRSVRATTPVEWMRDNAPDPVEHRNGGPAPGDPTADAYPQEWLTAADLHPRNGGLGSEGFINRKAA